MKLELKSHFLASMDDARPADTIRQFKENGADAIIENINQLPNILNKGSTKL